MMSPFWLKNQELLYFNSLSNLVFKIIINSYNYYDFNLIGRLWESIVLCKKKKKNWNTKSDIVSLPSLTSIYQFLKTKILKQKTLADPQDRVLIPSLTANVEGPTSLGSSYNYKHWHNQSAKLNFVPGRLS